MTLAHPDSLLAMTILSAPPRLVTACQVHASELHLSILNAYPQ
jgi:hypothetical protein